MFTKNQIWDALGDKALSFATFCVNANTDTDKAIRYLFEQTNDGFDLNNPIFTNQILPYLLSQGIIDQAAIDRINLLRL
jgi:uncharacterized UBP type Zn finger protein